MIRPLPARKAWRPSHILTFPVRKRKENCMTIVIGLMADSRQPSDPTLPTSSYLLLCADTQATYAAPKGVPLTSHPSQGKIYELPHGFYAAFCDDYHWSHVVAMELYGRMLNVDMTSNGVRDLLKIEILASFDYAFSWYREEVLRQEVGITLNEYLYDKNLVESLRQRGDEILRGVAGEVPAELLIMGQTHRGPLLIKANAQAVRESTEFFVSGAAQESAIGWLRLRDQRNNMSVPRSGYHLVEAKRFAQLDPTVGRTTQIVVISPNGQSKVFHDDGVSAMSKWKDIYGIKDTEELDREEARELFEKATGVSLPPTRSASQK
jgi:hypothetical protein